MSQDDDVEILYTHEQITNFQKEILTHKNDKNSLSEKLKFQQKETEGFKLKLEETIKVSKDQAIKFTERIQFYEQANMTLLKQQQDLNKQLSQIKLTEENIKKKETINDRRIQALQESNKRLIEQQRMATDLHTNELQRWMLELDQHQEQVRQLQQRYDEVQKENVNLKQLYQNTLTLLHETQNKYKLNNLVLEELQNKNQQILDQLDLSRQDKTNMSLKNNELENQVLQKVSQIARLETTLLEYQKNSNNLVEVKILEEMQQKYRLISSELEQLTLQNISLRNEKQDLIVDNQQIQKVSEALSNQVNQLEGELIKLTQIKEQQDAQNERLNIQFEEMSQKSSQQCLIIQDLKENLHSSEQRLSQAFDQLKKQELEIQSAHEINTNQKNIIADLKSELNVQLSRLQGMIHSNDSLKSQFEGTKANFSELEKVKNQLQNEVDRLTSDRDRVAKILQEKEEKYQNMKKSAHDFNLQLNESIELLKQLQNNQLENHQTFDQSGSFLLRKELEDSQNALQITQNQLNSLQGEFLSKERMVANLQAELENLRGENQNLTIQLEQKIALYKQDEINYRNINKELNNKLQTLIERNQVVEAKLRCFQGIEDEIFKKADLENQIEIQQAQIQRLEEDITFLNKIISFEDEDITLQMIEIKLKELQERGGSREVNERLTQLLMKYE